MLSIAKYSKIRGWFILAFEEDFPSLKNKMLIIDNKIVEYTMNDGRKINVFREIEIEKHCLDKAKVLEVIDKIIPLDEKCANNMILNNQLKKELRLM